MNKGYLSGYFEGVGVKTLSAVDAVPNKSNQHEIGTTAAMRKFLGTEKKKFEVTYLWLNDEQETITESGWATHYNSREGKPRAPEYRLYYPSNMVTGVMTEGDTLFLAIRPDKTILFIVVPAASTIQSQLLWLFGMEEQPKLKFTVQEFEGKDDSKLDFVSRFILDEIGIEFEDPDANSLDAIIERFGMNFPGTAEFSALARLTLSGIEARDDPDAALLAWLNHEEAMFRRLEKRIVAQRVSQGFTDADGVNVDEFIRYSLEVHNRRKSRMGHSFQNQLKAVFDAFRLRYDAQVLTEKGKKPDFIFPGKEEYYNPAFRLELLTMLAAKSTCKDRWPQILPEAERIREKHLVTLEPGITSAQTNMMRESGVRLIVPQAIQSSYTSDQRVWLMDISGFVALVLERQSGM
jgi:hypothetical protein